MVRKWRRLKNGWSLSFNVAWLQSKSQFYLKGTSKLAPFTNILYPTLPSQQYMFFLLLIAGVSAIMAWENRGHRRCLLDGESEQYACAIGDHSVESGNFHNVYIRLKAQKHGKIEVTYFCCGCYLLSRLIPWFRVIFKLNLNGTSSRDPWQGHLNTVFLKNRTSTKL